MLPDSIISGGAKGTDTYAKKFAKKYHIPYYEYLPEYKRYGIKAPLVRNKLIVDNADAVLAFWDGESRGTKYTIVYANKIGKPVKIIRI